MNRELAYIRNGKLNRNAAEFTIPVSQDLDAVHLAWKMLPNTNRGKANSGPVTVSYRMVIETKSKSLSNDLRILEDAMYQPSLNVSHQGQLSLKEEIVRISLPCNGRVHAMVDVDIRINFEITNEGKDPSNLELNLQRQKTCTTQSPYDGIHGESGGNHEWQENGSPDTTFVAIILSAFVIMIFTIIFIITVNYKGGELIFGVAIGNDKTMQTTTTLSSNPNKNNPRFLVGNTMDSQFPRQQESNNEDMTNPYEAITNQNPPLVQDGNVLTYNDAGLLTMDPRSGGALSSMHVSEQPPPPPPLPPPMINNQQFIRNCVGARGVGGVFNGNKFEFVGAEFNSDAESRVTDWVNQHQKQHEAGKPEQSASNYPEENDAASGDDNANLRTENTFENLQVDRHRLKLGCLLQEGTFGRVYQVIDWIKSMCQKNMMSKS